MSAEIISIVTAQDVSAAWQSDAFAVKTGTMAILHVSLTWTSGAVYVWAQSAPEESESATDWYDVASDVVLDTAASTTAGTIRAVAAGDNTRNVLNGAGQNLKAVAVWAYLPAGTYRLSGNETGTTVGTVTAKMVVK